MTTIARGRVMGTSRIDGADAAAAPREGVAPSRRPGLHRWLRAAGGGVRRAEPPTAVEELESEVALLREENARLRVARERAAERPVNERVRAALPLLREAGGDIGDEPWELLTECMLLRDGLADACRELEHGARELRLRLESILPGAEDATPAAVMSDDLEEVA